MSVTLINIFEVPAGDEDEFNAAIGSQGFPEAAADLRWPFHPSLYQVVRTG
jgi:hypothetical protein